MASTVEKLKQLLENNEDLAIALLQACTENEKLDLFFAVDTAPKNFTDFCGSDIKAFESKLTKITAVIFASL